METEKFDSKFFTNNFKFKLTNNEKKVIKSLPESKLKKILIIQDFLFSSKLYQPFLEKHSSYSHKISVYRNLSQENNNNNYEDNECEEEGEDDDSSKKIETEIETETETETEEAETETEIETETETETETENENVTENLAETLNEIVSSENVNNFTETETEIEIEPEVENDSKNENGFDHTLIIDIHLIYRFLCAKKWKISETKKLLIRWINYRIKVKPHLVKQEEVLTELLTKKTFWKGKDKENSPILYFIPQRHDVSKRVYSESIKLCYYLAEKSLSKYLNVEDFPNQKKNKFIIVCDGSKLSLNNIDIRFVREFFSISDLYCDMLKTLIIINGGFIFNKIFTFIKSVLDPETSKKMVVVENNEQLLKYIHKDQLIDYYGGNNHYSVKKEENISKNTIEKHIQKNKKKEKKSSGWFW